MGFALWTRDGLSWAMGTHEYRPMGTAIISSSDCFQPRDFHPRRQLPSRDRDAFLGFYASIAHLNQELARRRNPRRKTTRPRRSRASMAIL